MKIIMTGLHEEPEIANDWRERCTVEFIPLERLITSLKSGLAQGVMADVIVARARTLVEFRNDSVETILAPTEAIVRVVDELRKLDSACAMPDGRKWSAIPFIVVLSPDLFGTSITESTDVSVIMERNPTQTLCEIEAVFQNYRDRLLDELDNLGLLVTYEHGRYRVGPALAARDREKEGYLYYGPADRREANSTRLYTIDREAGGIQYEVELFESLINRPDISENDLQRFFVENPHFLVTARLMQALSHVRLEGTDGKVLIPDFVLKPIVALQRDSTWEVVDLKLPQAKLLAGPRDHGKFSSEVIKAIAQVKDYRDYFEDPRNAASIQQALGHKLRHPRLAVLIGRMPRTTSELEELEKQQGRELGVRIVTYDEILEAQKRLIQ